MPRCACISQSQPRNRGVVTVRCQKDDGHDGLHEWRDSVHPGHSKLWAGNVTEPQTSTAYRFESADAMRKRFGLVRSEGGDWAYKAMMPSAREVEADSNALEVLSQAGVVKEAE